MYHVRLFLQLLLMCLSHILFLFAGAPSLYDSARVLLDVASAGICVIYYLHYCKVMVVPLRLLVLGLNVVWVGC